MHLVHVSDRMDAGGRCECTLCVDPVCVDVHVGAPVEELFHATADLLDLDETSAALAAFDIIRWL